jgi:hypothetical protein
MCQAGSGKKKSNDWQDWVVIEEKEEREKWNVGDGTK